ncbi:radial spike protein 8 [Haematococcus lacustris]
MQSHASRHAVSEFLQQLHPELSPPFPKNVIADEVAEAFGRRSITKLVDLLKLPAEELPHEIRAHALRVFNGLLTTQEHKNDAINRGACIPLTHLIESSPSFEVRKLSCEALASLAQVLPGRQAIAAARGMYALTAALQSTPEAAAGAFRQMSTSNDGVDLLSKVLDTVVPALVTLITLPSQDDITLAACTNTASTLAGICTTDAGIESCLQHSVPAAVVALATRCLTGDFRFEEHAMEGLEACADCFEQLAHHPAGKTALRETRAIEMLATMLSHCMAHRGAMLKATSALLGVSVEKESKVPVMLFAGVQLVRLVKDSPDEYLVANARAAVVSASEHLEARSMTQALLSDREQMDLIFKGPLPPAPPDFRYRVVLPYGAK